jgi:hypothetical protein
MKIFIEKFNMKIYYYIRILTVIMAISYMTLIIFSLPEAKRLVVVYGTILLLLTTINLWGERNAYKS